MRSLLPFLFILICPLMMLFMMRGMHGHASHTTETKPGEPGKLQAGEDTDVAALREQRAELEARVEELESQVSRLAESRDHEARMATPV
jgi:polyhydroxyalkanoate synthesis regulator phasin